MVRYYLDVNGLRDNMNAEGKAPTDVCRVMKNAGYARLPLRVSSGNWLGALQAVAAYGRLTESLEAEDVLFVQYPFYLPWPQRLCRKLMESGVQLEVLVHDLDSLRGGREESEDLLRMAGTLVVHTPAMKRYLVEMGVDEARVQVLHCFDYFVEKERHKPVRFGFGITFAGNLCKSGFLRQLRTTQALSELHFSLYGAECPKAVEGGNVVYRGSFKPDDLSALEGDWGLVWDGDTVETCSGGHGLGHYLRYNASHKLSLYLAAGMPLIVWSESGVSDFVVREHLGIAVASLSEIPQRLKGIIPADYDMMREAVAIWGHKVKEGKMLRAALGLL